jgi:predicted nucleotidyltransferase
MTTAERDAWIAQHKEAIAAFCQKWQITEFAFFGSVLRDDFGPESDIDVLVTFGPDARETLYYRVDMVDDLETVLGRKVDLVNRQGVERSRNPIRRNAILESAQVVYAA